MGVPNAHQGTTLRRVLPTANMMVDNDNISLLLMLGDKRFCLLRSLLPFRGLCLFVYRVCLSVCLSDTSVHCAQTAEDINKISFACNSRVHALPDHVKMWLTWVNPNPFPKLCPKGLCIVRRVSTFLGVCRCERRYMQCDCHCFFIKGYLT